MSKKVVTLGELMLRLAPAGYYRFVQADTDDAAGFMPLTLDASGTGSAYLQLTGHPYSDTDGWLSPGRRRPRLPQAGRPHPHPAGTHLSLWFAMLSPHLLLQVGARVSWLPALSIIKQEYE